MELAGESEEVDDEKPVMAGRSDNINATLLGSLRLMTGTWFEAAYYGGIGLNNYRVRVKDRRTHEKAVAEQVSGTILMGLFFKVWIFELIGEVQTTSIEQRDGSTRDVQSTYAAFATSLNL